MRNDSTAKMVRELRRLIASTPPGSKLPSNRELVAQFSVSPVTVQNAMRALDGLGLIERRPGVGTFARALRNSQPVDFGWQSAALRADAPYMPLSSTQRGVAPDAIGLHSGYPALELLPERLVRSAINRAARTDVAMTRAPVEGIPELRAWFASQLASATPTDVTPPTPREALIIAGSQSGLSSIFRSLVGVGRPLLIESPTYWGAILAARQAGVTLVPVPTGPSGPDPAEVDRRLRETGARALYAQPTYSNPLGGPGSRELGLELLDVVRQHSAFLVEDDWAHDFGIDSDPHPVAAHDRHGSVVYLRSLTKSVSPALRVAAVIARGPAKERILSDRAAESMYVSGLLQAATLDVVTQQSWKSHVRSVRQQLRARRGALVSALADHAPEMHIEQVPVGGLNLWARLPDSVVPETFVRECESEGVIVSPGTEWFPAEPPAPYVRLNYSGPNPERFREAAEVMGRVLRRPQTLDG